MNVRTENCAVVVLGDQESEIGKFVACNLLAAGVEPTFANSTDEFLRATSDGGQRRLILIEPDWDLMLLIDYREARLSVVKWRGATWSPPWDAVEFEVEDAYLDGALFQRHIKGWLKELDRGST